MFARKMIIVVIAVCLTLAVAEVGLALFGPDFTTLGKLVREADDSRIYILKPNADIEFKGLTAKLPQVVDWRINSQGIREDYTIASRAQNYRIATYGDSETYGWSVKKEHTFQEQMERIDSNIEVINFGIPGYNSSQIAEHARQTIAEFKPHLVIYLVHKNDMDDPMQPARIFKYSKILQAAYMFYQAKILAPERLRVRYTPERMQRLGEDLVQIAESCRIQNIPLILGFIHWESRKTIFNYLADRPGSSYIGKQMFGIKLIDLEDVHKNALRRDRHFTAITYEQIARKLCTAISGTSNNKCTPSNI